MGLTAATQADADMAAANWGLDFPQLADPSCTLVDSLNERGWITSVVERSPEITTAGGAMAQGADLGPTIRGHSIVFKTRALALPV